MMHDLDRVIVDLTCSTDYLREISTLLEIAQDCLKLSEGTSQLKTKVVIHEASIRLETVIADLRCYHRLMVAALVVFGAAAAEQADRTHQQTSEAADD